MYHGRLVPAPPSMPAPPPPVHEVEDEPVVDVAVSVRTYVQAWCKHVHVVMSGPCKLHCCSSKTLPSFLQPPSLSPSLRWRSARQMGLPVPTHLPHPLGDVPEDDVIDSASPLLAASFSSAANQMLPPIPVPTGLPPTQELRQTAGKRYRKTSAPPTFPGNPYGDLLPLQTAPPTGRLPPPPTSNPPAPPIGKAPSLDAIPATGPSPPPPATSVAPPTPAGVAPSAPCPPSGPGASPAVPPPPPPPAELKSIHTQIAENKMLTAAGTTTSE